MKFSGNVLPFRIIFEDNHILVLDKPGGMLTQSTGLESFSLQEAANIYLKKKYAKSGDAFIHPIHRLDRGVSGIVLFAKSSKALSRLNAQMREKKIKKKYLALVEGSLKHSQGRLINYLVHREKKAFISSNEDKKAKRAALHYLLLQKARKRSLVLIELVTGRYHQIRAQMSALGHPICGDKKYGSKDKKRELALHCFQIEIAHPISGKNMVFYSEAPFCREKNSFSKKVLVECES